MNALIEQFPTHYVLLAIAGAIRWETVIPIHLKKSATHRQVAGRDG